MHAFAEWGSVVFNSPSDDCTLIFSTNARFQMEISHTGCGRVQMHPSDVWELSAVFATGSKTSRSELQRQSGQKAWADPQAPNSVHLMPRGQPRPSPRFSSQWCRFHSRNAVFDWRLSNLAWTKSNPAFVPEIEKIIISTIDEMNFLFHFLAFGEQWVNWIGLDVSDFGVEWQISCVVMWPRSLVARRPKPWISVLILKIDVPQSETVWTQQPLWCPSVLLPVWLFVTEGLLVIGSFGVIAPEEICTDTRTSHKSKLVFVSFEKFAFRSLKIFQSFPHSSRFQAFRLSNNPGQNRRVGLHLRQELFTC